MWAAPSHAGWFVRVKRTGFPIGFSHVRIASKHGALEAVYGHIIKGTKNTAAAEAFLNLYLDPEVQFEFAKQTGVVPVNGGARQRLATDPEVGSILLLTDAQLDNAFLIDWKKLDPDAWRETWNRSMKR